MTNPFAKSALFFTLLFGLPWPCFSFCLSRKSSCVARARPWLSRYRWFRCIITVRRHRRALLYLAFGLPWPCFSFCLSRRPGARVRPWLGGGGCGVGAPALQPAAEAVGAPCRLAAARVTPGRGGGAPRGKAVRRPCRRLSHVPCAQATKPLNRYLLLQVAR